MGSDPTQCLSALVLPSAPSRSLLKSLVGTTSVLTAILLISGFTSTTLGSFMADPSESRLRSPSTSSKSSMSSLLLGLRLRFLRLRPPSSPFRIHRSGVMRIWLVLPPTPPPRELLTEGVGEALGDGLVCGVWISCRCSCVS